PGRQGEMNAFGPACACSSAGSSQLNQEFPGMRTTTAAKNDPAAAEPVERTAPKRGRARAKLTTAQPIAAPPPSLAETPAVAVTAVRMLKLDEGLYALRIGRIAGSPGDISGMTVPVAHVSA